jgi:hypothetical protein
VKAHITAVLAWFGTAGTEDDGTGAELTEEEFADTRLRRTARQIRRQPGPAATRPRWLAFQCDDLGRDQTTAGYGVCQRAETGVDSSGRSVEHRRTSGGLGVSDGPGYGDVGRRSGGSALPLTRPVWLKRWNPLRRCSARNR